MPPRHGGSPSAIPGSRTNSFAISDLRLTICCAARANVDQAARQLAQQSLQNSVCVGQHHSGLPNRKLKILNHKFSGGRAYQLAVPIAQSTERARPKRQVAGESPAGDTKTKSSNNQA